MKKMGAVIALMLLAMGLLAGCGSEEKVPAESI